MSGPLNNASATGAFGGVAADSHSLDQLKRLANQDPAKAVKQVSTQFEALFMQMVLKSMREATPKSGLLESSEHETYRSMLDEQLAQKIAGGGTGLGRVIERQLMRNLSAAAPSGANADQAVTAPSGAKSDAGNFQAAVPASAPLAPIPDLGLPKAAGMDVIEAIQSAAQIRGVR